MSDIIVEEPRPHVTLLTLNRPEALNAFTSETIDELFSIFDRLTHDANCRVVVLTGAGKGFCAGHDIKVHDSGPKWLDPDLGAMQSHMFQQKHLATMVGRMRAMPQPIIAAINGAVAGGGYPLALGADLRIASSTAKFRDAFIRTLGASGCEMGLSWLLMRSIGFTRAAELLLTGRDLGAEEAERIGLVLKVVPPDQLLDAAYELADQILLNNPFSVWMTKATMWSVLETPSLETAIDLEARTQMVTIGTLDQQEQSNAFHERRPAVYNNR